MANKISASTSMTFASIIAMCAGFPPYTLSAADIAPRITEGVARGRFQEGMARAGWARPSRSTVRESARVRSK